MQRHVRDTLAAMVSTAHPARTGRDARRRGRSGVAAVGLAVGCLLAACGESGGSGNSVIIPPDGGDDARVADARLVDARGDEDRGVPDARITDGRLPEADVATDGATPPDLAVDAAADAADAALPVPACRNAADDDADGLSDYPADPGCESAEDPDETDPDEPACGDRIDNDDDGVADLNDPGCASLLDPNEANICGELQTFRDVTGQRRVEGDTTGGAAVFDAGCRTNLAPEAVFLVTAQAGLRALQFDTTGSGFDTVLSVRSVCDVQDSELSCNDDLRPGTRTSALRLEAPAAGDYFVVVDGFRDSAGPFVLNIHAEVPDGTPCPAEDAFETCGEGSVCTDGTCQRAVCFNGQDDDADDRTDYPLDPGCDDPTDQDEADPAVPPQCANGDDDDFNGLTDFPADPGCEDAADTTEQPLPDCQNGLDDDEDGLIDLDDPGCRDNPEWPFEYNTAACRDGQDNDFDGRTDYPFDPGCDSLEDATEIDPEQPPACADIVDNDGNGETDYPADAAGCVSAADPLEAPPCDAVMPEDITGQGDVRGTIVGATNEFAASCNPATGPEVVFTWHVAADRELQALRLTARGSRFDSLLSVREQCEPEPGIDLACSDFGANDGNAELALGPQAPGTDLWIVLDSNSGSPEGIYRLRVTALLAAGATCGDDDVWTCGDGLTCREGTCQVPACGDALDNDRDGVTDWPLEPGCTGPVDDDEVDPESPAACGNREDDDGNGFIDYPADPGCGGVGDEVEAAECGDGEDNDGDGDMDFDRDGDGNRDRTADPQCECAADPHEGVDPACSDLCDNDGDGLADLADPGCEGDPARISEVNVPHCRDGNDNDGDGFTDFPNDPGCLLPDTALETDPARRPQCADGIDNDGDGRVDHASQGQPTPDEGCVSAAEGDERGPCDTPKPELPATGTASGNSANFPDEHRGECGFSDGAPDVVYLANVPFPAHVVADTNGSDFDTLLYVRSACVPEVICPQLPPADAGVPDAAVVLPDAAVVAPDAAVLPPDAALLPPDAAVVVPDAAVLLPDAAVVVPDAAVLLPDANVDGPLCVPGSTELACDDDGGDGAQSRVEFDWEGGPLYLFVDGFASNSGDFTLNVQITFPAGGLCDAAAPAYMACAAGSVCTPQPDGAARCVP